MEITSLPDDALLRILSYLDTKQLLQVRRVCRHWRDIALHPHLWRTRTIDLCFRGKALFKAVLRLAPCVHKLLIASQTALEDHADCGLLLTSTTCAAEHLEFYHLNVDENLGLVIGLVTRNQAAMGRLKKLNLHVSWYQGNHGCAGLWHLLAIVVGCRGLNHLDLTVRVDFGNHDWSPLPLTASAVPHRLTDASLNTLHLSGKRFLEPHLEFLLASHAATLETVIALECRFPAALLAGAAELCELECLLLDDMSVLLQCRRLQFVTLYVGMYPNEDPYWFPSGLKKARAFFRGPV